MNKKLFLRSILILCFSFALVSCSSEDVKQDESTTSTITLRTYTQSSFEIELLDLINQDRVSKGLNALSIINEISYVGSTHNDYMISAGAISHDNFTQRAESLQVGLGALSVGENVASGFNTAQGVLNGWNNSPAHKANLEGNYTHFGVAVKADSTGKKYYTLLLIRK